jgi:hypothetical protein
MLTRDIGLWVPSSTDIIDDDEEDIEDDEDSLEVPNDPVEIDEGEGDDV